MAITNNQIPRPIFKNVNSIHLGNITRLKIFKGIKDIITKFQAKMSSNLVCPIFNYKFYKMTQVISEFPNRSTFIEIPSKI